MKPRAPFGKRRRQRETPRDSECEAFNTELGVEDMGGPSARDV